MTEPQPVAELGYADALAELEAILDRLEHDEPDVDRVAADVARAAELVARCRERITAARLTVEEVVAGLAPTPAADTDDDTSGGGNGGNLGTDTDPATENPTT
jgi:exodeoxyribonuclease VII small subunit